MPYPYKQPGRWFTWEEFCSSPTARKLNIYNIPTAGDQIRIENLVANVLDPLRDHLEKPVRITSGFRTGDLNRALNGSKTSQHMYGQAADIKVDGMPAEMLALAIVELGLEFDQMIWYAQSRGGHVHISYTPKADRRGEMLHAPDGGGYVPWSP